MYMILEIYRGTFNTAKVDFCIIIQKKFNILFQYHIIIIIMHVYVIKTNVNYR